MLHIILMKIYLKLFVILILLIHENLQSKDFIILQSTTSVRDSGLYDFILPEFSRENQIDVRVVAVGTGQAIKNAQRCDADVLIVHHKQSEEKLVREGFGLWRKEFMYNDYVLIGPKSDPEC